MPSPHQTPDDAPIEPQVVADLCTGDARVAPAAAPAPAGQVNWNWKYTFCVAVVLIVYFAEDCLQYLRVELLRSLRKEQRCRRVKERIDCFGMARAEEKAPLRDSLRGLLLLMQCYSVHHPVVQMVLFARNKFAGTFACCKSMAPKSIFDMAKRLHASALSNCWKTDWNSARTKSETPNVGTFSDISTGQSIVQRNELTENESPPSDTDASGAAWVAATAAPHHATGNHELLSGFIIEHDDQFVHAVDGITRKVLARGAVITDSVVLPDVWFVPGLTENLVSVSQLVDLDHSVGFSCGECCVRSTDGKVVGKGHLQEGGIYVLDFLKVPLAI